MGSSWLGVAAVDERRQALDKGFGLFPMREMSCRGNDVEPGAGNFPPPTLAVVRGDNAVLRAPQQQGRPVDAVQPALEARVVHVRFPAVERECFASAHDRRQLAVRQSRVVDLSLRWIGPSGLTMKPTRG